MIDHTGIHVADVEKSAAFYEKALAPLGYMKMMEFKEYKIVGLGEGKNPDFWIQGDGAPDKATHNAFRARNKEEVDAFHTAGLEAGGKDNGGPGIRENYSPDYYAAFVIDPDGNNVEAVYRGK